MWSIKASVSLKPEPESNQVAAASSVSEVDSSWRRGAFSLAVQTAKALPGSPPRHRPGERGGGPWAMSINLGRPSGAQVGWREGDGVTQVGRALVSPAVAWPAEQSQRFHGAMPCGTCVCSRDWALLSHVRQTMEAKPLARDSECRVTCDDDGGDGGWLGRWVARSKCTHLPCSVMAPSTRSSFWIVSSALSPTFSQPNPRRRPSARANSTAAANGSPIAAESASSSCSAVVAGAIPRTKTAELSAREAVAREKKAFGGALRLGRGGAASRNLSFTAAAKAAISRAVGALLAPGDVAGAMAESRE